MATYMPISGSFRAYATKFIDPALGFALGWNYWYNWAITIAAEMVAGSIIMRTLVSKCKASLLEYIIFNNNSRIKYYYQLRHMVSQSIGLQVLKVITVIIFLIIGVLIY